MKRLFSTGLFVIAGFGVLLDGRQTIHAATITDASTIAGLNLAIPDDAYTGTLASMTPSTITVTVAGSEQIIVDVDVTIALDHTYAGDLTIKLQSPTGTLVTLLNRPGLFTPDDGSQTGGDASNLSASFAITYDDSAGDSAEDMGQGLLDTDIIGNPLNGSPSIYYPDADGAGNDLLAAFNTENANGTWTLYIADGAPAAIGALQQWSLHITTIPEPTTGLLAAGSAIAATALRRPRSSKRTS